MVNKMTEKHVGYLVILEEPIREDDAENSTLNAIKMIKGVAKVVPQKGAIAHQMAVENAKYEIYEKLHKVLE